jgi:hypothetical protein
LEFPAILVVVVSFDRRWSGLHLESLSCLQTENEQTCSGIKNLFFPIEKACGNAHNKLVTLKHANLQILSTLVVARSFCGALLHCHRQNLFSLLSFKQGFIPQTNQETMPHEPTATSATNHRCTKIE